MILRKIYNLYHYQYKDNNFFTWDIKSIKWNTSNELCSYSVFFIQWDTWISACRPKFRRPSWVLWLWSNWPVLQVPISFLFKKTGKFVVLLEIADYLLIRSTFNGKKTGLALNPVLPTFCYFIPKSHLSELTLDYPFASLSHCTS